MVDYPYQDEPSPGLKKVAVSGVWRKTLLALITVFFIFWVVIPLTVPGASYFVNLITLPFRHLGVFVHEMGHGLFTLLSGGSFYWFQMELMQGGTAITSGGYSAFTLLGGLLGPALMGAVLLQVSTSHRDNRWVLWGLMFFFLVGCFFMIRPLFLSSQRFPLLQQWSVGMLVALIIPVGGGLLTWWALRGSDTTRRFYLQVMGILMCYAAFCDTNYIFKYEMLANGLYSDSRRVAAFFVPGGPENVPHLIFVVSAVGISLLNFALMAWGTYRALRRRAD